MDRKHVEYCSAYYLSQLTFLQFHVEELYVSFITLKVDWKFQFKFKESARNEGAMHEHYKLNKVYFFLQPCILKARYTA